MTTLVSAALVLALLPVAPIQSQTAHPGYRCTTVLNIEQPANSPLKFELLSFSAQTGSNGAVSFTNKSAKDIEFYLAIFDLLDSNGKYLMTVPISNAGEHGETPLDGPFELWLDSGGRSYDPPTPGGGHAMMLFNSQLTVLTCPNSARVSALRVQYTDQRRFEYTGPSLNILPALLEGRLDHPEKLDSWAGVTATGVLDIDSSGKAAIEYIDSAPVGLQQWLPKQIAAWKFSAAAQEKGPVASRLPFMLIIGHDAVSSWNTNLDLMREKGLSGAVLTVFLVPSESTGKWIIACGPFEISGSPFR
jgi:hypothetical protein